MYRLDPKEYDELLNNNVTKSYKKSNIKTMNEINKEANVLTEKLKINNRVQCIARNEAFITIKDHKPNFPNNVACRLLYSCKSEYMFRKYKQLTQKLHQLKSMAKFKNCY